MSEPLLVTIFAILFIMVLFWFALVKVLFKRLESSHPKKYEAMGRPSLFLRNSPANLFAMLKFLMAREHKNLSDSYLSKLSDAMLVFFFIYIVLFIALFFSIASQVANHAP